MTTTPPLLLLLPLLLTTRSHVDIRASVFLQLRIVGEFVFVNPFSVLRPWCLNSRLITCVLGSQRSIYIANLSKPLPRFRVCSFRRPKYFPPNLFQSFPSALVRSTSASKLERQTKDTVPSTMHLKYDIDGTYTVSTFPGKRP